MWLASKSISQGSMYPNRMTEGSAIKAMLIMVWRSTPDFSTRTLWAIKTRWNKVAYPSNSREPSETIQPKLPRPHPVHFVEKVSVALLSHGAATPRTEGPALLSTV